MKRILLVFVLSVSVLAQTAGVQNYGASLRLGAGAPVAGSCGATSLYIDTTNNLLYIGSTAGTCTLAGGGGSSITGTGTLHDIPVWTGAQTQANSTGLSEAYPTFTVNESQTTNGTQAVIGDMTTTQLTAPSTLACVQGAATGGFLLHNQAYFYKVTAISANGETTVSNESTFTTGALPAPDTYTASCTWTGHTGDTGYKLYRATTTGNELLLATITPGNVNGYTDNTNTTPAGAMPSANTTGTIALATGTSTDFAVFKAGGVVGNSVTLTDTATGPLIAGTNGLAFGNANTAIFATASSNSGLSVTTGGGSTKWTWDLNGAVTQNGLTTTYNSLATVGNGLASVQAAPTAVTIGSGANIASTSLCSTTLCPAGDYDVGVYIEITTACTTTGTYIPWLGWTDDQGAKTGSSTTTYFGAAGGLGVTPATASTGATLGLASLSNFLSGHLYLHTTGAATNAQGSINYGATATACGTGGPMVGKMYFTVTRLR